MRTTLLILFTFIWTTVSGQDSADSARNYVPVIYGDRLKEFLDSIKVRILADTAKYDSADLVFTATGRKNTQPYSPLFIINGAYLYKLDIIKGSEVLEFVNEILIDKKIKSITYIDSSQVVAHFKQNAWQGLILITMFEKAQFNPKVAGLTIRKNNSGDNFTVRKKSEVLTWE